MGFRGIVRYGSSRDRSLQSEFEPLNFPTHNLHKNNKMEHKMTQTLTWMGVLTLFGGAILLAKHFDRANKELDDTFDESVTAFNQDWE